MEGQSPNMAQVIRVLWLVVVLIAMNAVLQLLSGLFSYVFGIVAAVVVLLGHLGLQRYVKSKNKPRWMLWLPVGLAALSPLIYVTVKIIMAGSLGWATLKMIIPPLLASVLPVVLLLWVINRLKNA